MSHDNKNKEVLLCHRNKSGDGSCLRCDRICLKGSRSIQDAHATRIYAMGAGFRGSSWGIFLYGSLRFLFKTERLPSVMKEVDSVDVSLQS